MEPTKIGLFPNGILVVTVSAGAAIRVACIPICYLLGDCTCGLRRMNASTMLLQRGVDAYKGIVNYARWQWLLGRIVRRPPAV